MQASLISRATAALSSGVDTFPISLQDKFYKQVVIRNSRLNIHYWYAVECTVERSRCGCRQHCGCLMIGWLLGQSDQWLYHLSTVLVPGRNLSICSRLITLLKYPSAAALWITDDDDNYNLNGTNLHSRKYSLTSFLRPCYKESATPCTGTLARMR